MPPFLHAAPLDNLEFPGTPLGEDSLFAPTHSDRVERTTSHLFPLCSWHPEGCGLLAGKLLDFDNVKVLLLGVKRGSELSPPFWHVFICLQVGVDPLTC